MLRLSLSVLNHTAIVGGTHFSSEREDPSTSLPPFDRWPARYNLYRFIQPREEKHSSQIDHFSTSAAPASRPAARATDRTGGCLPESHSHGEIVRRCTEITLVVYSNKGN